MYTKDIVYSLWRHKAVMNIVYLLTNTSKITGTRFYIGSKSECSIITLNNIPTIVSLKNNQPYLGSSKNFEFQIDLKNNHIFKATLLEEVTDRSKLLVRENYYIEKYNAVNCNDYYNLAKAYVGGNCSYDSSAIKNIFKETILEFGKNESNWSKKNNTAKNCNFLHFGELYFYIINQLESGKNCSEISKQLGKERHFCSRYIKTIDLVKAKADFQTFTDFKQLRKLVTQGASKKKACELLNISEVVGVYYLYDFNRKSSYTVAHQKSLSVTELEDIIGYDIINNKLNFKETAKKNSMTIKNTQRYFLQYVRKRLGTSDT